MRLFGLVGFPLIHSSSKSYFQQKFKIEKIQDCNYKNYIIEDLKNIRLRLKNKNLNGFNVTIPHKENIIPFLDKLSLEAKEIKAVNTVLIQNDKWVGYNTDWIGFYKSIKPILKPNQKKALILGSGGSSKAIIYALKKLNIKYEVISRKKEYKNYNEITKRDLDGNTVIINCTPLGTYPNTKQQPDIPYQFLNKENLLYDLTYNPQESNFLCKGKYRQSKIKNGLEMFKLQAEESWKIWNYSKE